MRDLLNGLSVMSLLLVVALAGATIFNDGGHSTQRGEQQEVVTQQDEAKSAAKRDDMNDDRETEVTTIPVSGSRPEGQPDNTAALEANMRLDDLSDFGAPSHRAAADRKVPSSSTVEEPPAEKPSVPDAIALLERLNRHFND